MTHFVFLLMSLKLFLMMSELVTSLFLSTKSSTGSIKTNTDPHFIGPVPDKNQKTEKNGSFLASILQHSSETKTTEATLKISSWKSQKTGFLKTGGFPLVRIFFLYEQRPKLGHSSQVHPITGCSPMLRSCLLACWKGDWLNILRHSRS